jgi:hypothetical protein
LDSWKWYAKKQEGAQKDVERAFGVLQAQFTIVARLSLTWSHQKLKKFMKTCVILHNMIVEDEKSSSPDYIYDRAIYTEMQHSSASAKQQLSLFACNHKLMTNSSAHSAFQDNPNIINPHFFLF